MSAPMTARHIDLARTLPPRLQRFFAHNPPVQLYPSNTSTASSSPTDPSLTTPQESPEPTQLNPFQPHKNPQTQKWNPPLYSLRQQADIFKLARLHNVEDLLPFSVKSTAEKERKKTELGSRIKGTGAGQNVKGHKWERTLKGRLDKRRAAMLGMDRMVQDWKRLGHGKGWKKFPK